MRILLSLMGLLVLAGCAELTPAERAARMEAEVDEMIEVYGPACDKLGYKRESDQWRNCIVQLAKRNDLRHYRAPTTTTCVGHRGFYQCTTL